MSCTATIGKKLFIITVMLDIFNYSFMVRAFAAGLVIGTIAPLIGTFLVARRFSLIADTLGHVSLAGIALGLLLHVNPIITAMMASILIALVVDKIRQNKIVSGESALAMLLSGGLALAIVLVGLARGFNVDLFSYLFGSITTIRSEDLMIILPVGIAVAITILVFYKQLLYISFDEDGARVSGVNVNALNMMLMILTAITVSLSIRIIGSLLIGALLVIPVTSASQISRNFKQSIILSIIFSLVSVTIGLFISFYANLPAGGTVVLISLVIFIFSYLFRILKLA